MHLKFSEVVFPALNLVCANIEAIEAVLGEQFVIKKWEFFWWGFSSGDTTAVNHPQHKSQVNPIDQSNDQTDEYGVKFAFRGK